MGARVYAVTFEPANQVQAFREREGVDIPILRDPRRAAYKACGIDRKPAQTIWSPATIWYYVRQALQGRLPHARRSDYFQLGGDVVLSSSGERCWVHASREPADRPDIDRILKAIDECTSN